MYPQGQGIRRSHSGGRDRGGDQGHLYKTELMHREAADLRLPLNDVDDIKLLIVMHNPLFLYALFGELCHLLKA